MSNDARIGGAVGEIRSDISVDALNAYLAKNCSRVKTPVNVKQFKVSYLNFILSISQVSSVWTGKALKPLRRFTTNVDCSQTPHIF